MARNVCISVPDALYDYLQKTADKGNYSLSSVCVVMILGFIQHECPYIGKTIKDSIKRRGRPKKEGLL